MLVAALVVFMHLAASEAQLRSDGWMPIEAIDQPTGVVEAGTRSWNGEDTLGIMLDVGSAGHDLVSGVWDDSAARRADSTIGLTDEVALIPKTEGTPSIAGAAGGIGDVAAKVAKRLRPKAGMILKIAIFTLVVCGGIVAAVGATIAKVVSVVRKRSGARHDGHVGVENMETSAPTS